MRGKRHRQRDAAHRLRRGAALAHGVRALFGGLGWRGLADWKQKPKPLTYGNGVTMKAIVLDGWHLEEHDDILGHRHLAVFVGPDALQRATEFIGTLPKHDTGRYWLDACCPEEDAHCSDCGCPSAG